MLLVDMKEPPEWPEPQTFCDSCWWYDDIQDSRFDVVMYCHYHEEVYEDYEICDDYEDAARIEVTLPKMKSRGWWNDYYWLDKATCEDFDREKRLLMVRQFHVDGLRKWLLCPIFMIIEDDETDESYTASCHPLGMTVYSERYSGLQSAAEDWLADSWKMFVINAEGRKLAPDAEYIRQVLLEMVE